MPMMPAPDYPKQIDLDLSTSCNLKCVFCHMRAFHPPEVTWLDYEKFLRLDPLLPHLEKLTLFGKFEPLTCRDFLPIFKHIAAYDNIELYFSTNGLLLNEEIMLALVGRLKYLTVSVTGFTREKYKKYMGRDGLDRIREVLGRLNELKRAAGTQYPILRISTVGLMSEVEHLTDAVDFAREFNAAEGVQLTYLKAHTPVLTKEMPLNNIAYFSEQSEKAIAYAREIGIKLVLQSGSFDENARKTEKLGHKECRLPWERMSIQPDGKVYPCPAAYEPIGSFFHEPILDIWRSDNMKRFRQGVNTRGEMNGSCVKCTHCRHRSISQPEVSDYSRSKVYITGMKRR